MNRAFSPRLSHDSLVCSDGHGESYPAGLIMTCCTFCIFISQKDFNLFENHKSCLFFFQEFSLTLCASLQSVTVSDLNFTLISMKRTAPLGRQDMVTGVSII